MVVWEALDALSHQLELCKIGADTRVVVLFDDDIDQGRASQIRAALARTGAEALEVRPLDNRLSVANNQLLPALLNAATVAITTNDRHLDLLLGNVRRVLHLPDIAPHAFPPHASLRLRVSSLIEQVRNGSSLTISDPNGTDLRVELSGSKSDADDGLLDPEHNITCFPSGWVSITPARGTVNGQLVIMPGDANLGATRLISSPLVLQIVNDHISAIDGESPDADVLRALFEYPGDASAYGIAQISVGMNPGKEAMSPFDNRLLDPIISRLLAGVITISFGENLLADRPCSQKVPLALPSRTLQIDGLPIVNAGRLDGDFAPDVYEL